MATHRPDPPHSSCLILLHRQILHFLSLHMTEKQNVTAVTTAAGCNSTLFPFRRRFNLHISLPPSLPRRVSALHTVTALACFISSSSCLQIQGGADDYGDFWVTIKWSMLQILGRKKLQKVNLQWKFIKTFFGLFWKYQCKLKGFLLGLHRFKSFYSSWYPFFPCSPDLTMCDLFNRTFWN